MVAKSDLLAVPSILNGLLVADAQGITGSPVNNLPDPVKKLIQTISARLQLKQTINKNLQLLGQVLQQCEKAQPKGDSLILIRQIATMHGAYTAINHLLQQVVSQLEHNAPATQLVVAVVHRRFQTLPALLTTHQNEYSTLLTAKIKQVMKTQPIDQLSGLEFEIDNLLKNYVHQLLSTNTKSPNQLNQKTALKLSWFIIASKISHRFFRSWLQRVTPPRQPTEATAKTKGAVLTKEPPQEGKPHIPQRDNNKQTKIN